MLARVEFEGEERVRSAYAQGKGVLFVTGHFGFWELQAHGARAAAAADGGDGAGARQSALNRLLERIRTRTGNTRHLPAGRRCGG